MNDFLAKVKEVFNPPEESALSRILFERIPQGLEEPITEYYARKLAAFHGAVPNATPASFLYLKDQMIKGICSSHVRQKVIEGVPTHTEQLREVMLQSVAIAMECIRMDAGNVGSMDGLRATTNFVVETADEPMDLSSI